MSDDVVSNVIQFPKDRQVRPLTEADVASSVQEIQKSAIERVIDEVFSQSLEMMCRAGYCLHDHDGDDATIRDHTMIYNAFRSAVFRKQGIEHPLQDITDDLFKDVTAEGLDEDDEGEMQ